MDGNEKKLMIMFGKKLRKRLIDLDMTYEDFIYGVGASRAVVYRWMHGRGFPSFIYLPRIVRVLKVDYNWLFDP